MSTLRDVLYRGFPVTTRLCELPRFAEFTQRARLTGRERAFLGDVLVTVDAEALDRDEPFDDVFEAHLQRLADELVSARAA